ncbi:hypothetical protein AMS68_005651 [Peltaster fructicola]|uniref:Methyltransferase domain-containing protein n=1 Tax=Peltaster fructicola TaxID=286661 RepID=A0A6H0XZE6_9PEZI|nr:hypothetical protein AMS68_005651 [Peltaster fructicola]
MASTDDNTFLERAYALTETSGAKTLYDEWAASYDEDLDSQRYVSPQRTVEAIEASVQPSSRQLTILDAGCGTGLVGDLLKQSTLGKRMTLTGCDVSPGMLEAAARRGVYHRLDAVDLSKQTSYEADSYDIIACCGTLTKGHVGPGALREFVRIVSSGGLIVATVHNEIWESGGYRKEADAMKSEELVDVVSTDEFGIIEGLNSGGIMLVLRKK